jgi:hypothetical protein
MSLLRFICLLGFLSILVPSSTSQVSSLGTQIQTLLSPNATISYNTTEAPRWSEFDAPNPGLIVNVATEKDVQVTVRLLSEF